MSPEVIVLAGFIMLLLALLFLALRERGLAFVIAPGALLAPKRRMD